LKLRDERSATVTADGATFVEPLQVERG